MNQLTPKLKKFYEDVESCEKEMPTELFILQALVVIAVAATSRRVKVKSVCIDSPGVRPLNIFTMIFANSGVGKDRTFNLFRPALNSILRKSQVHYEQWKAKRIGEIKKEAEAMYGTQSAKDKHIQSNMPESVQLKFKDATNAGFLAHRMRMSQTTMGSMLYLDPEYSDKFSTAKDANSFARSLLETWDTGSTEGKTNRADSIKDVDNLPVSMLAYSTPVNANDQEALQRFLNGLSDGLARRTYFLLVDRLKCKWRPTLEENRRVQEEKGEVFNQFAVDLNVSYECITTENHQLTLTTEADERLNQYKNNQMDLYDAMPSSSVQDLILRSEVKDRWFRAVRVAGMIAFFEHPKDRSVSLEDLEAALWFTDSLALNLSKIVRLDTAEPHALLFPILMKKGTLTPTQIRGLYQKLDTTRRTLENLLRGGTLIEDLRYHAATEGYALVDGKSESGGGIQYSLQKI